LAEEARALAIIIVPVSAEAAGAVPSSPFVTPITPVSPLEADAEAARPLATAVDPVITAAEATSASIPAMGRSTLR
jgi:hypothetical protein